MPKIMVVEDNQQAATFAKAALEGSASFAVSWVQSAEDCLTKMSDEFALVILDVNLPAKSGLDILPTLRHRFPQVPIIVFTASSDVMQAIEAMRLGAVNYLIKPVTMSDLIGAAKEALAKSESRKDGKRLQYSSQVMRGLETSLDKLAPSKLRILLTGSAGVGKREAAHRLFESSKDAGRLHFVNCVALTEAQAQKELFGNHAPLSQEGTVVLEEVLDLSADLQQKLLAVLQSGTKARVMATSSRDPQTAVKKHGFRQDLLYLLAEAELRVPDLSDRMEDLETLVKQLAEQFAEESPEHKGKVFAASALEVLRQHDWPGNLRELKSAIRRLMIMSESNTIEAADVRQDNVFRARAEQQVVIDDMSLATHEKDVITKTLEENNFNIQQTAKVLKISRTTLYRKMKKFGIAS